MVTMYSDHSLTSTGLELLKIVQAAPISALLNAEQVATHVPYPLYRVRISLTELEDAKLLSLKAGQYQLTEAGLLQIAKE